MEKFLAPNGKIINIPPGRVIVKGLSLDEIEFIKANLPNNEIEILVTDEVTDLVAISATVLFLNIDKFNEEEKSLIIDCYTEIGDCSDETVFWIGEEEPPKHLKKRFQYYRKFEDVLGNMKYMLLKSYQQSKKVKEFSKRLADSLIILSEIRLHPGIKTQELATKMEVSTRTIQRYIATLQMAGEWIEYDHVNKGWRLQYGISIFFGDHLDE